MGELKHGKWNTRLYGIYSGMKSRCRNANNPRYKNYGGKGIKVCDEWLNDFNAFYNWATTNGYKDDLSIERIDINKDYEPSNCCWIPLSQQSKNKSNNIYVYLDGERETLFDYCKKHDYNYDLVRNRITRWHWSLEKALTKDTDKKRHFEYNGKKYNYYELSKITGLTVPSLKWRLNNNWTIERLFRELKINI